MFRQWFLSRRTLGLLTLVICLVLPIAWWAAGRAVPRSTRYLNSSGYRVLLSGSRLDDKTFLEDYPPGSSVVLKELATGRCAEFRDGAYAFPSVVLLPDDGVLAAYGKKDHIQVLEAMSGREIARIPRAAEDVRFNLASDGTGLVTDDKNRITEVWDLPSGNLRVRLPSVGTSSSSFSPDGRTLVSYCFGHRSLLIHDPHTGLLLGEIPKVPIWAAWTFSIDGQRFAAPTPDGIVLWDIATAQTVGLCPARNHAMALSQGGKFLVVHDRPQQPRPAPTWLPDRVRQWLESKEYDPFPPEVVDTTTGESLAVLPAVWQVQFLPDGTLMTYDSAKHVIQFWDVPPRVILPWRAWRWLLIVALVSSVVWLGVRRYRLTQKQSTTVSFAHPAQDQSLAGVSD